MDPFSTKKIRGGHGENSRSRRRRSMAQRTNFRRILGQDGRLYGPPCYKKGIANMIGTEEKERRSRAITSSWTYVEAAKKCPGLSASALRRYAIWNKIHLKSGDKPKVKRAKKDTNRRMGLYQQGLSDKKIAEIEGLTENTIFLWRKRNGLPANRKGSNRMARRNITEPIRSFFREFAKEYIERKLREKRLAFHDNILKGGGIWPTLNAATAAGK